MSSGRLQNTVNTHIPKSAALSWHKAIVQLLALRDTLLPKLIGGALRLPAALCERAAQAGVKDAESFIARVGI